MKNTGSKSIASRDVSASLNLDMDFRTSPFGIASTHPTFYIYGFHFPYHSYTVIQLYIFHHIFQPFFLQTTTPQHPSGSHQERVKKLKAEELAELEGADAADADGAEGGTEPPEKRQKRCKGKTETLLGGARVERMGRSGSFVDVFLKLV